MHVQELQNEPEFNAQRSLKLLNRGYIDFCRQTKALRKVFAITTVANQETYDLDSQILKVTHVKYLEDSSTEHGVTLKPLPGGHASLPKSKTFGWPVYYYILYPQDTAFGRDIGTYPIIDVSSETLNVYASYQPTEMTSDANSPTLQESYHEALIYYAVWKAFSQFSHKKTEWLRKAKEFETYYKEMVIEAQEEFAWENDDIPDQVVNVY